MPTYQYECDSCNHAFETLQSMMDDKLTTCPECKQETLHRLIGSGSGIIFKGTGFYETDYKNTNSGSKTETKTEPKAESKPEPKETKTESKTESASETS